MDVEVGVVDYRGVQRLTATRVCIEALGRTASIRTLIELMKGGNKGGHNIRWAPHRNAPQRTVPHLTAPHRTAPHRTAPHRTAPHRTSPHRTAPHRTAPHRPGAAGPFAYSCAVTGATRLMA
jgi:hypothetical protein